MARVSVMESRAVIGRFLWLGSFQNTVVIRAKPFDAVAVGVRTGEWFGSRSPVPVVDNFRTFEWPKPEMLQALYAR